MLLYTSMYEIIEKHILTVYPFELSVRKNSRLFLQEQGEWGRKNEVSQGFIIHPLWEQGIDLGVDLVEQNKLL